MKTSLTAATIYRWLASSSVNPSGEWTWKRSAVRSSDLKLIEDVVDYKGNRTALDCRWPIIGSLHRFLASFQCGLCLERVCFLGILNRFFIFYLHSCGGDSSKNWTKLESLGGPGVLEPQPRVPHFFWGPSYCTSPLHTHATVGTVFTTSTVTFGDSSIPEMTCECKGFFSRT